MDFLVFGNNKQHRLVQTLILVERWGDRIKALSIGINITRNQETAPKSGDGPEIRRRQCRFPTILFWGRDTALPFPEKSRLVHGIAVSRKVTAGTRHCRFPKSK
ncbi:MULTISPECIES: hypothetical protein [unclassified Microcoleus]|uniref:hypothetical protein n=1 Tax=unclassified Microcoleus TaxID=2642155 RepID=UPI002FD66408